jgi:uncharacterized protein (TIGR03083 family)
MGPLFTHKEYVDLVGEEITRLAALVRSADPALPVPTCDGWTLQDLAHHVGTFHRWATDLVGDLAQRDRSRDLAADGWDAHASTAEHADWLAAGGEHLLATLRDADPDTPMWAWGSDQHVRFWSRRATHETGVHRADASLALGIEPRFEAAVAVDGVSEFLENVWHARTFRWNVIKLRGQGETIRLTATDTGDEWTVVRERRRPSWQRHQPGQGPPADVAVRGTAADLYLMLWGRYPCTGDRFAIIGETALLDHWQRHSAV